MLKRLIPDPFLLQLLGTVALATLLPAQGRFATPVGWLSIVMVFALFFFHGAKLAREQVVAGLLHWRLHLTILLVTFAMFPLIGVIAAKAFPRLLPPELWLGVLFVCALPGTVQSAIAFVSIARGNVSAAIASASASQMIGIVLTPFLMGVIAGAHGGAGGFAGIGKVALQIFAPFLLGHLLRPWIGGWVARHRKLIGHTDRGTILVAVYSAFSTAVLEGLWHRLPPRAFAILVAVDLALLGLALLGTWAAGRALGFPREDRIAILFGGTKKSLVQAVPMARVLFPPAQVGVVLLPIMLFHQLQLMACAYIARRYATDGENSA